MSRVQCALPLSARGGLVLKTLVENRYSVGCLLTSGNRRHYLDHSHCTLPLQRCGTRRHYHNYHHHNNRFAGIENDLEAAGKNARVKVRVPLLRMCCTEY